MLVYAGGYLSVVFLSVCLGAPHCPTCRTADMARQLFAARQCTFCTLSGIIY